MSKCGVPLRAAVGGELVCLGGDAARVRDIESASVESGGEVCASQNAGCGGWEKALWWIVLVLQCPAKMRMGAERETADLP